MENQNWTPQPEEVVVVRGIASATLGRVTSVDAEHCCVEFRLGTPPLDQPQSAVFDLRSGVHARTLKSNQSAHFPRIERLDWEMFEALRREHAQRVLAELCKTQSADKMEKAARVLSGDKDFCAASIYIGTAVEQLLNAGERT